MGLVRGYDSQFPLLTPRALLDTSVHKGSGILKNIWSRLKIERKVRPFSWPRPVKIQARDMATGLPAVGPRTIAATFTPLHSFAGGGNGMVSPVQLGLNSTPEAFSLSSVLGSP
ncbi:hypothetical protein HYALB_00013586 [Hymenoscyphus albidus]|uniref:Uncharacterized protein n=1 Tax=Hymenoscyphus albidus TaxID=595503 RepID=A0A9N9LZ80_9HELO|nr:hypothetical protein HYALB_00013586 [Hymenoscyphus albidus]